MNEDKVITYRPACLLILATPCMELIEILDCQDANEENLMYCAANPQQAGDQVV